VNLALAPPGFLLRLPRLVLRILRAERTLQRAARELPERLERNAFPAVATAAAALRARDWGRASEGDLLQALDATRRLVFDDFAPQGLKASVLAGLAIRRLEGALRPSHGPNARRRTQALLAGAAPPPEQDLAAGLRDLARGALTLDGFLRRFGHRGPGEMELASPRWREAPGGLPRPGEQAAPDLHPPAPIGEVAADLPAPIRPALERARRLIALREAAKHHLMLAYDLLRILLLELDRRFHLDGGVFYLEPDELPSLLSGEEVRTRIALRRRRRTLALGLEAPRVLFSDDLEALGRPQPPPEAAAQIEGTAVAPGVAEGPALVAREPADVPAEARDYILVCPSTDPGWVPLFLRARGLVLEAGGILSHGAIVARELGLPAVANVADACGRFSTGQRLRVDGGSGRLWRL
jgi:pyruvate,water dikinase